MQQLAALLSASPAETFDQLQRACNGMLPSYKELVQDRHQYEVVMTSKPPPVCASVGHHDASTATSQTEHSSFSIENILSSSPPRRGNHGDDRQHQQPDKERHHHLHYQITADESLRTYNNTTSLPTLPLTHAFYGQCRNVMQILCRDVPSSDAPPAKNQST